MDGMGESREKSNGASDQLTVASQRVRTRTNTWVDSGWTEKPRGPLTQPAQRSTGGAGGSRMAGKRSKEGVSGDGRGCAASSSLCVLSLSWRFTRQPVPLQPISGPGAPRRGGLAGRNARAAARTEKKGTAKVPVPARPRDGALAICRATRVSRQPGREARWRRQVFSLCRCSPASGRILRWALRCNCLPALHLAVATETKCLLRPGRRDRGNQVPLPYKMHHGGTCNRTPPTCLHGGAGTGTSQRLAPPPPNAAARG